MFHVEQIMKTIIFAILISIFTSCTKMDPNPENSDDIYKDLVAELEIATKSLESAQKQLDSIKAEFKASVPQTGQIKYATKKLRNAEAFLAEMNQRKIYFDIKKDRRKNYVKFRYEESHKKGGRPWPDSRELEEYRALVKFNRDKLEWDRNKGMKKNVPHGTKSGENPADTK
jgi:hypothetical protein